MTTAEITSIEATPEYRLELARVALENAQRVYQEALEAKCLCDQKRSYDAMMAGVNRRSEAPLNGNGGFNLMR